MPLDEAGPPPAGAADDVTEPTTEAAAPEQEPVGEPEEDLALRELQAERDEYLSHLRRVQADFENYRKRMLREQSSHLERATEGLVERLLPVLDAFELAVASSEVDPAQLRQGIELVHAQLRGVLEREGLERIDPAGKPFDPAEHEAVMHVEGDGDPMVDDVMRPGYRMKGRVLRPAMVKVAR